MTAIAVTIGLADHPEEQRYAPFRLDVAALGTMFVIGVQRSGRSTALRTLAASLAHDYSPADVHLYAIEGGTPSLGSLDALPHCGAVVDARDVSRLERLLELLRSIVHARRRLLSEAGCTDIGAQRRAGVGEPLAYVVVMIDGLDAVISMYSERDGGRLVDEIESLVRDGGSVGVLVVLAADRSGFTHRLAGAVGARLVMRQSDPADFALLGVERNAIPGAMPPGRAVWAETGEEVQVALLCDDPSGHAQNDAVAVLAEQSRQRWAGVDGAALPARVDGLPDVMTHVEAQILATYAPPERWSATIAVGRSRLTPIHIDLDDAGTFLVCGPPRSGRTTALLSIATSLLHNEIEVVIVCPRTSELRSLDGEPGVRAMLTDDCAEELLAASAGDDVAVIVDDAELIADQRTLDALEQIARRCRDSRTALVAAATTDDVLLARFRGWIADVRRSRCGLLLRPESSVDGEAFDLRLPRSIGGGWPPGRALLVERATYEEVQVLAL